MSSATPAISPPSPSTRTSRPRVTGALPPGVPDRPESLGGVQVEPLLELREQRRREEGPRHRLAALDGEAGRHVAEVGGEVLGRGVEIHADPQDHPVHGVGLGRELGEDAGHLAIAHQQVVRPLDPGVDPGLPAGVAGRHRGHQRQLGSALRWQGGSEDDREVEILAGWRRPGPAAPAPSGGLALGDHHLAVIGPVVGELAGPVVRGGQLLAAVQRLSEVVGVEGAVRSRAVPADRGWPPAGSRGPGAASIR